MKSKFSITGIAALLAFGLTSVCHAQPSPAATPWWDCTMGGPRHGLALISFGTNSSFFVQEVIVPLPSVTHTGGRNSGGNPGRTGLTGTPSGPGTPTGQIFGSEVLNGTWGFDNRGRIIGNFIETSIPVCTTNVVPFFTNEMELGDSYCLTTTNTINGLSALVTTCYTNQIVCGTNCVTNAVVVSQSEVFPSEVITYCEDSVNLLGGTNPVQTTICYSNAITCIAQTNQFSFIGHVVPGQSLNLVCSTAFGKVTYHGVPAVQLPDISGSWYGTKTARGQSVIEFFQLTAAAGMPNTYNVFNGVGPGYHFGGFAMLSSFKQLGFALSINPEDPAQALDVRAVTGPFISRIFEAKTHGWDGVTTTNWVGFDAVRQSP